MRGLARALSDEGDPRTLDRMARSKRSVQPEAPEVGPFPFIGAGLPRTILEEYSLLIQLERAPDPQHLHGLSTAAPRGSPR